MKFYLCFEKFYIFLSLIAVLKNLPILGNFPVLVVLWVHIFTEIDPNFFAEQERGGLFHRHVTTVSRADESRLAEAANFYVVRYLTGSDRRYERGKLRT